ncbi:MAG: helicase [Deltaproteobacteria bacterium]|nr:helicase [Deltaproteobacteria bacterium]
METRSRFLPDAARILRAAVEEAGGIEILAVGDLDADGRVVQVEILARGSMDAVPSLFCRVRAGQAVIHNHPSGVLEASGADLALAGAYDEAGVAVAIVDNAVERELWVVEPHRRSRVRLDPAFVREVFSTLLPRVLPRFEARPAQVDMACEVAARLDEDGVLVAEAGTGTGKSLAYLVPAALWAKANGSRVAVSTWTRTLQDQLVGQDLPLLERAGLTFVWAVLKGRNNYACRRRIEAAVAEGAADAEEGAQLAALAGWAETSATGARSDLPFPISQDLWERIESDRHQTLSARCPHFARCFWYEALRAASPAHLVVLNHSLLLADLAIKQETGGRGLLPACERIVLDEAHHLEDAATSAGSTRVSLLAIRRAARPLLRHRERPGALDRLATDWGGVLSPLAEDARGRFLDGLAEAGRLTETAVGEAPALLAEAALAAGLEDQALPVDPDPSARAFDEPAIDPSVAAWEPPVANLADHLAAAARALGAVEAGLEGVEIPLRSVQPFLDLRRARLRLAGQAATARAFLSEDPEWCRWLEPEARAPQAALCRAPVDVSAFLASALYRSTRTLVLTSATLAVRGSFDHLLERVGLAGWLEASGAEPAVAHAWPSPFRFEEQALLGLPRDLPTPGDPGWEDAIAAFLVQAIEVSRGGAFVLCTSFQALRHFADRAEAALGHRMAILRQEAGSRSRLLARFREDPDSVLFATDSFWEGVDVKGEALRLVAIPRLPFGVPTEPVTRARHARLAARGLDPFRTLSLPEAVLKLRQGFGRLIRSTTDRGAVLVLDRRIHDRWYGRLFLASLPPARRAVGPGRAVLAALEAFYGADASESDGPPDRTR